MAGRNPLSSGRSAGSSIQPFGFGHDDPLSTIQRLFDEMSRSFGGPMSNLEQAAQLVVSPRMDIRETEREVEIIAELPGVNESDVDITVDDNLITIRGESLAEFSPRSQQGQGQQGQQNQPSAQQKPNYHLMERTHGVFQRQLQLPFRVDPNAVNATFKHGILHLRVEKPGQGQRQGNRIAINTGQQAQQQPRNVIDMPTQQGQGGMPITTAGGGADHEQQQPAQTGQQPAAQTETHPATEAQLQQPSQTQGDQSKTQPQQTGTTGS